MVARLLDLCAAEILAEIRDVSVADVPAIDALLET